MYDSHDLRLVGSHAEKDGVGVDKKPSQTREFVVVATWCRVTADTVNFNGYLMQNPVGHFRRGHSGIIAPDIPEVILRLGRPVNQLIGRHIQRGLRG